MGTVSFTKSVHTITGYGPRGNVLVATISGRIYQNAFADSRQEAVLHALEAGYDVTNLHVTECVIDEARNFAARQLLSAEEKPDYLVFFDDDMLLPHDIIATLVGNARSHSADVVGCLYTSRGIPPRVLAIGIEGPITVEQAWRLHREQCCIEVAAVPFGATLVTRKILERLDPPHFTMLPPLGEDYGFCERVREKGGRVMCDFGVSSRLHGRTLPGVAHLGVYPYSLLDSK